MQPVLKTCEFCLDEYVAVLCSTPQGHPDPSTPEGVERCCGARCFRLLQQQRNALRLLQDSPPDSGIDSTWESDETTLESDAIIGNSHLAF